MSNKYCYGANTQHLCNLNQPFYIPDTSNSNWTGDPINYTTNSWGFRSEEFYGEDRNSIIFLGCSHTFGIGLPVHNIWCHLVAEKMGLPYYNLAVGAGSLDSAFRVLDEWLPVMKSKHVFLQIPNNRREIIDPNGNSINVLPTKSSKWDILLLNDYEINRTKNLLAMRQICSTYGSKFTCLDSENFFDRGPIPHEKARDGLHYGPSQHRHFAKIILDI